MTYDPAAAARVCVERFYAAPVDDDRSLEDLVRDLAADAYAAGVAAERARCVQIVANWEAHGLSTRERDMHFGCEYDAPSPEKMIDAMLAAASHVCVIADCRHPTHDD